MNSITQPETQVKRKHAARHDLVAFSPSPQLAQLLIEQVRAKLTAWPTWPKPKVKNCGRR